MFEDMIIGDSFIAVRKRGFRDRGNNKQVAVEMVVDSIGKRWVDSHANTDRGVVSLQFLKDGTCPENPHWRAFRDKDHFKAWVKRSELEREAMARIKLHWRLEATIAAMSEADLHELVRILSPVGRLKAAP